MGHEAVPPFLLCQVGPERQLEGSCEGSCKESR